MLKYSKRWFSLRKLRPLNSSTWIIKCRHSFIRCLNSFRAHQLEDLKHCNEPKVSIDIMGNILRWNSHRDPRAVKSNYFVNAYRQKGQTQGDSPYNFFNWSNSKEFFQFESYNIFVLKLKRNRIEHLLKYLDLHYTNKIISKTSNNKENKASFQSLFILSLVFF